MIAKTDGSSLPAEGSLPADSTYDIIVVGGGMVGAAFACACAQSSQEKGLPLSIAVIEPYKPDYNWDKDSFDIRVSAITHASQRLLEKLGVWSKIKKEGAYAYKKMQVWDSTGHGKICFDADEVAKENLGHIIENRIIAKNLQQRLEDFDNITFICPFKTKNLKIIDSDESQDSDQNYNVVISNDEGVELKSKLVIGADGANSWLRQQANIEITSWAYEQTAVVTTVKTTKHPDYTCWQQFMPTGPLAFLPLKENYSSIVWSTTAQHAEQLVSMDETSFNQQLEETFGTVLGNIEVYSARGAFPLRLRHAKQYVKPALALIGDAAHTVHPLAGQGVNLGFLDADLLAKELINAIEQGKNPGSYSVLRKYERGRKASNITMLASMDILKRLFSNQNPLFSIIRNAGLNLAGGSSLSRKFFINYAIGREV